MSDYRKLEAWKLAHTTRLAIYRATSSYPRTERFSLVDQTRRAASSITTNIAEGAGHDSPSQYVRYLNYALGSANEVEDHLLLARDLGYLAPDLWSELGQDLARVRSMLTRLRQFMRRRATGDG
ncbi:MAG TPA: four helix bundle protein [Acidimicrobiia bacterium]|nr:four helix bundle protein [Acidimicrobiia bacterium]